MEFDYQQRIVIVLLIGAWHLSNVQDLWQTLQEGEYLGAVQQLFNLLCAAFLTYIVFFTGKCKL